MIGLYIPNIYKTSFFHIEEVVDQEHIRCKKLGSNKQVTLPKNALILEVCVRKNELKACLHRIAMAKCDYYPNTEIPYFEKVSKYWTLNFENINLEFSRELIRNCD